MPSVNSGLSIQTISQLSEIFARHEKVSSVVLYGSRAKGNWRNESDIDLTIHAEGLEWSEFQQIEREIDDLLLPWKIDLSLYEHIDNQQLREHIERVGKVFYRCGSGPARD
jgi:predicted nucleotidyltransferase